MPKQLKKLTIIASISLFASITCVKPQTEATAYSYNPAANTVVSNDSNISVQPAQTKTADPNSKTFLGSIDYKRVQINLTRDGGNLSGTYQYEKIGKDLSLSGKIDAKGNFTLQETDQAGNKTGEWKGTWKQSGGRATLTGNWKSPKGTPVLPFSADEQVVEFTGGAKLVTKSITENKAKRYEISAEYPELTGVEPATAANFNQITKKIVTAANSEFKSETAEMTDEDLRAFADSKNTAPLYDYLTYDTLLANDDVISILFDDANFTGGAHGNSGSATVNFDLKNNRELKLADIFAPNSNYLKIISAYSTADLKPRLQKDGVLDNEMLGDGTAPKEENFKSWNLTKKGLQINFDAYQVAAYVEGPQVVVIPYGKLQNILRKDGVAVKLAK